MTAAPPVRHRAREVALQILYQFDTQEESQTTSDADSAAQARELIARLTRHFDHFQVAPELREFAALLVSGTLHHRKELDAVLDRFLANWKLERLGKIDRTVLRMASYELKYVPETPAKVVIDEAIELGKRFGSEDTSPFVNGILDAILKEQGRQSSASTTDGTDESP